MLGYRQNEFTKDRKQIEQLLSRIKPLAEKELGRELARAELYSHCFNSEFEGDAARKLRSQFVKLHMFQESWIPAIKRGTGFRRFELYDLAEDPGQKRDLAAERPDVLARMKSQLLALNASVLGNLADRLFECPKDDLDAGLDVRIG